MTQFLDVRLSAVGGGLRTAVGACRATCSNDYRSLDLGELLDGIKGRHVLIATHGFNVDRADGIACLSNWESLLQLPQPYSAFVGLLWPGDSVWAHGLDYPDEPKIANAAGGLVARFLDGNFAGAASISFASHSLGARVVLETITQMSLPVRRLVLMAGAIDDNCLNTEYKEAAAKIGTISLLASKKDSVLTVDFPLGNFFAGILAEGHPWWRAALGHCGPAKPWPANFKAPFEMPDIWEFKHGNYLQIDQPPAPDLPIPVDVPPQGTEPPLTGPDGKTQQGWQEAFSSAFASTRFR
ncbi:MAG: alpha/beta hydrolase [Terracidiphilus sp.]|nr:alpha/beta hydrolase [Terracidiphilus sp.]